MFEFNYALLVSGLLLAAFVEESFEISCYQCGEMTDGRNFLSIENIPECDQDILESQNKHITQCPENDQCCFSLREHFTVSFWGHAATAKVFVRGCCSSLNATYHHLPSSHPPPLVTSTVFRAEILSQTVMNGNIKSRVMFCNTDACNLKKIPWSLPVTHDQNQGSESKDITASSNPCTPLPYHPSRFPRRPLKPKIVNVNRRLGRERRLDTSRRSMGHKTFLFDDSLKKSSDQSLQNVSRLRDQSEDEKPNFCECNCNCPTLICSSAPQCVYPLFLVLAFLIGCLLFVR
ncbi:uncharacterized protein [Lepeophtheirus salmonis]|uniref:uncharacterized protein n=1 Tax=Lepeophtheirus salmonis TaxID=72036 RepID=UPI001AE39693|nr:uncharacterized protein LOC121120867 [Lepeophtheirus salmonis]